jgi:predicted nucleotide-binding protein
MPSDLFKTVDRRHFAVVVSKFLTHGGMNIYESGLGFNSDPNGDANKDHRAAALVNHLFEQPDTDELIVDLLDHLFVSAPYSDRLMNDDAYKALDRKVLQPRGVVLTDDGYQLTGERITMNVFDQPQPEADELGPSSMSPRNPATTPASLRDVSTSPAPTGNNHLVFVVHGRDIRPVTVLDTFLTFCGLEMMSWAEARRATGKTQPTTYEIVLAGITRAAAVIVIFSPDDLGRVKDDFAVAPTDPDKKPQGQARQNVILEAGMAFGIAPEKTIFVQSSQTRPLSDIDGFNWVKLDGLHGSREDLIGRLIDAKAPVRHKTNLLDHTAGPFKVS